MKIEEIKEILSRLIWEYDYLASCEGIDKKILKKNVAALRAALDILSDYHDV